MASRTSLLDYIKTQSQVDCDSQDISVAEAMGRLVDCTSNQADAYDELLKPRRAELLHKSVAWARKMKDDFPEATLEELAAIVSVGYFERVIGPLYDIQTKADDLDRQMVNVLLTMAPHVSGKVLVMANPKFANSARKLEEDAKSIVEVFRRLAPDFDMSRICIKVTATWEGLEACRKLSSLGIQTLATTVFTLEQAMLAAESGCYAVSPFVHDLAAVVNGQYDEHDNIIHVCIEAQEYFHEHSFQTQVKAAAVMSVEEVKKMAGVAAMTLPAGLLQELQDADVEQDIEKYSMFKSAANSNAKAGERVTFADNQNKYLEAFGKSEGGKGKFRTEEAIEIFCGFQNQLEMFMRETSIAQHGVSLGSPETTPLNLQPGMVEAVVT